MILTESSWVDARRIALGFETSYAVGIETVFTLSKAFVSHVGALKQLTVDA
jgi:hypothetical protein